MIMGRISDRPRYAYLRCLGSVLSFSFGASSMAYVLVHPSLQVVRQVVAIMDELSDHRMWTVYKQFQILSLTRNYSQNLLLMDQWAHKSHLR